MYDDHIYFLASFLLPNLFILSSFHQTSPSLRSASVSSDNRHSLRSMRPPGIKLAHEHDHNYIFQLLKYGFVVLKLRCCCSLAVVPIDVHRPVVLLMLNSKRLILKRSSQTSGLLSPRRQLDRTLVHQFCAAAAATL